MGRFNPPCGRARYHLGVMDGLNLKSLVLCTALCLMPGLVGCDTLSSDFQDLVDQLSPTSPAEAGQLATDFADPENQQRGLTLLGTAPWGGEEEYLRLYRNCVEGPFDPLVKAAAIRALAHHGDPADAVLIATALDDEIPYVRNEAAKGLQRLHEEKVVDAIWQRMVIEENSGVHVELAIALGQYPKDSVFQALVLSLEAQQLAVNLAAADSLRTLTGQDHGLDARSWLAWYDSSTSPFAREEVYFFPVYTRPLGWLERINIFNPIVWEKPGLPRGLEVRSIRSTWSGATPPDQEGT
jgi:hypothetical protein